MEPSTVIYTHPARVAVPEVIGDFSCNIYSTSPSPETQLPHIIVGYMFSWYRSTHPLVYLAFPPYPGALPLVQKTEYPSTPVETYNSLVRTLRHIITAKWFTYLYGVPPKHIYLDLPLMLRRAYEYDPLRAAIETVEGRDFFTEEQWRQWCPIT